MRYRFRNAAPLPAMIARAFVYALAIALLIVFGPAESHVFIYQGF